MLTNGSWKLSGTLLDTGTQESLGREGLRVLESCAQTCTSPYQSLRPEKLERQEKLLSERAPSPCPGPGGLVVAATVTVRGRQSIRNEPGEVVFSPLH